MNRFEAGVMRAGSADGNGCELITCSREEICVYHDRAHVIESYSVMDADKYRLLTG
ncbi:hypothetical protein [Paenibacillus sp. Z6-24]